MKKAIYFFTAISISGCFNSDTELRTVFNTAPIFNPISLIKTSPNTTYQFPLVASDLDGDPLQYSFISSPEWALLAGDQIILTPLVEHIGQHQIIAQVSDGHSHDQTSITIEVNPIDEPSPESNAILALQSGDHQKATLVELTSYGQTLFRVLENNHKKLLASLYNGISQPLTWHPTHDSAYSRNFRPSQTFPVLSANINGNNQPSDEGLVFTGEWGNQKYAFLGANLFAIDRSEPLDQFGKNLLGWLSNKDLTDATSQLSIVTSHLSSASDSYWFQHNEQLNLWLDDNLAKRHIANTPRTCDGAALLGCLQDQQPDVLMLSHRDSGTTYAQIEPALTYAKKNGISLMLVNYSRGESIPLWGPLLDQMGLVDHNNYWSKHQVKDFDPLQPYVFSQQLSKANQLLSKLASGDFDTASLEPCNLNFLNCTEPPFVDSFKAGADWYRNSAIYVDQLGDNPFSSDAFPILKIGLLIADKFRQQIDYPIHISQHQEWQQALFADWVVSYARPNNHDQPDLGEYIIDKTKIITGEAAHYHYPETTSERQKISVPYSGQWTSTGWYALPGNTVTITRNDNSSSEAYVKLHYARDKTNRVFETNVYQAHIEQTTERLKIPPQGSVTFSTPYGAPIYIKISHGDMSVDVSATGIAKHPAVLNFGDPQALLNFERILNETEIPHIDLKNAGAEQHLRRDRFIGALGDAYPTVSDLLQGIKSDHIGNLYTLAGYKLPEQSLEETLPVDVLSICKSLFGDDCSDNTLHVRTNIQHANYDQNAQCGFGCAGNPWDSGTNITPTGWLDNHELGHNLQTHRLNVAFTEAVNKNQWQHYQGRATENSVNIFPYYVLWKSHYIRDGKTDTLVDSHMNHKDIFNVVMSDILKLTDNTNNRLLFDRSCNLYPDGEIRFIAPWKSNAYAIHNSYRMGFYIQLLLQIEMFQIAGQSFDLGYHIFTLMYLHDRIFGKYATNEQLWNQHRTSLGFSEFDYTNNDVYGEGKTITAMPGNDFMLVALSFYTQTDWRPYFDMFGLHYSDLAAQQVILHAGGRVVDVGMYVLEDDLPPRELSKALPWLPLNFSDLSTLWPRDNSSPADCLTH